MAQRMGCSAVLGIFQDAPCLEPSLEMLGPTGLKRGKHSLATSRLMRVLCARLMRDLMRRSHAGSHAPYILV